MCNALVFLVVNKSSQANVSRRSYLDKHSQKYLLKTFYKHYNRCHIQRKKYFALRKPFIKKMDCLFKLIMKTEVSEMFHLERVEALLFVATSVYKCS